jgi:hypothetical protein
VAQPGTRLRGDAEAGIPCLPRCASTGAGRRRSLRPSCSRPAGGLAQPPEAGESAGRADVPGGRSAARARRHHGGRTRRGRPGAGRGRGLSGIPRARDHARVVQSDTRAKQTPERHAARGAILDALCAGDHPLGIRLSAEALLLEHALADGSGDTLDAIVCALQAGWALQQRRYGVPATVDPIEGWIVGVPAPSPDAA